MLSLKLIRGAENADGVRLVVQVPLDQARFVIGRDPSCDWPIADKKLALSARHCEIVRLEGRHVLRDTSTNGTSVNEARERLPADHVLRHGDRIGLGSYLIEVTVVSDAAAVPARAPVAAAPSAPRRGGDPAAMVGADWQRAGIAVGGGGPPADVKTGLTRISKPPPKDAAAEAPLMVTPPRTEGRPDAQRSAPGAPGAAGAAGAVGSVGSAGSEGAASAGVAGGAAREAVRRAPPGTTDVLQRLAGGLGVPVEALGSTDPALAAERVARLLRVAVLALHRQLAAQAKQLRELGSRTPLARSEAARLRMAPGPDDVVAALLAAGDEAEAALVCAHSELLQHAQRMLAAFSAAGVRMGEQLAPAAVERSAEGAADAARLWKIYSSLWTALGIGVGKSWTTSYGEAAAAYLAAAYDDPRLPDKSPPDNAVR